MWLFTPFGFFSIVKQEGFEGLCIRARVREDLDNLRRDYLPELSETVDTPEADYHFRAYAPAAAVAAVPPAPGSASTR
jgi:hypothetical protein